MDSQSTNSPSNQQKHVLHQDLDSANQQFEDLLKRYQELEFKSKADIKVLVKEVKSLRSSQAELKERLNQSLADKSKAEELLQEERDKKEHMRTSWKKLLDRCKILHNQLQECNVNNFTSEKGDDLLENIPSLSNSLDLVATSDNQIGLLLSEVQHLAEDVASTTDRVSGMYDDPTLVDEELRHILTRILADNGLLRKQVNSLIFRALRKTKSLDKVELKSESDLHVQNEI